MKIIVTEDGLLWNSQSPTLAEYAESVIVISYYMSEPNKHDTQYKHLDIKIPFMLGMDENGGMTSIRYRALAENIDNLKKMLAGDHNVLILSDNIIHSLLPYKLLQSLNERYRLHLWTIAPFRFEGRSAIAAYNRIVEDLSNTESVLAMKLEIPEGEGKMQLPQYIEHIQNQINELLPDVILQIEYMHDHHDRKYFYDFNKGAYIDTTFEKGSISVGDESYFETLGVVITQRSDGKELCNKLKHARRDLASANGIDFQTEECSFDGACGGTCPKCDEELKFLMEKLSEIETEKRVYPELIIPKFLMGDKHE